ncbi:MAG: DEAD/DEAH box helicase [Candidatus Anstonellales archaeon]
MYRIEITDYNEEKIAESYLIRFISDDVSFAKVYYLELAGTPSMVSAVISGIMTGKIINIYTKDHEIVVRHMRMTLDDKQRFKVREIKHTIKDIVNKTFVQKSIAVTPLSLLEIDELDEEQNLTLSSIDKIIQYIDFQSKIPLPDMDDNKKREFIEHFEPEILLSYGFGNSRFCIPRVPSESLLIRHFDLKFGDEVPIKKFMEENGKDLKSKALEDLKPIFVKSNLSKQDLDNKEKLNNLLRPPLEAQKIPILSIAKGLSNKKGLFLVGEMGTGKTFMSIAVSYLLKAKRSVVLCPTHLIHKWEREIKSTIPNAVIRNMNKMSISEILSLRNTKPESAEFWVLGKEQAKLHYATKQLSTKEEKKTGQKYVVCPNCGRKVELKRISRNYSYQHKCECGEVLEYADNSKFRRYAKSLLLKKYFRFDLLIADEVHELKGDTAQGQALANLASVSNRILALTGTLMGGYANNLFNLLWRVSPQIMQKLNIQYNRQKEFVEKFGVYQIVSYHLLDRKMSIGKKVSQTFKEKPGISPALISSILENAVFIKLNDISDSLPTYEEEVVLMEMSEEQQETYSRFEGNMISIVNQALKRGDKSLLGKMVQSLYGLPDGVRKGETVNLHNIILTADPVDQYLLPKEEFLVDVIREERAKGRKVLVYLEHTGTRDLMPDLKERIETLVGNGIKVDCLYSDSVKVEERETWIENHDNDVLIVNPRIVQTGLDLYQYPTIVFFQTGYSIFTLRQASRRSWRIGQDKPVKVYYLAYSNTIQEKALKLMASKMEASLATEGDLTDKGLSALSEAENSILIELARSIEEKVNTDDVKNAWKNLKKQELFADADLQDTHNVEENTTLSQSENSTVSVDGKVSRTRFTIISNVKIASKTAIFSYNNDIYNLVDGKVVNKNKVVGKYVWETSKKTGNKFAKVFINNEVLFIGKHVKTGKFVCLKIA